MVMETSEFSLAGPDSGGIKSAIMMDVTAGGESLGSSLSCAGLNANFALAVRMRKTASRRMACCFCAAVLTARYAPRM